MMKLHLIYLTLCSLAQAAYISRMAIINNNPNLNSNLNQNRIRTTAFRPGVMLRPWIQQRLVQAASHRVPYVFYRNTPQRYTMKYHNPPRIVTNTWKAATRVPTVSATPSSAEYDFVRAAAQTHAHAHANADGAIHTIPAPNLSLAEKPIVVLEETNTHSGSSESPKVVFASTESYPNVPAKIEQPIGFSKTIEQPIGFSRATSMSSDHLSSLVRNSAALQLASELGLSAVQFPHKAIHHHHHIVSPPSDHHHIVSPPSVVTQPNLVQHNIAQQSFFTPSIVPQQFSLQNFHSLPNPQDIMQVGPNGIVISPNALLQPDPTFLQKLQSQLLQRFPGVEFVPYAAEVQSQSPLNGQTIQAQSQIQPQIVQEQTQIQPQILQEQTQIHPQKVQAQSQIQEQIVHQPVTTQPQTQTPFFLLQNEQITRQRPSSFVTAESNQRNVYQRGTPEAYVVTVEPQITVTNVTENQVDVSSLSTPQNVTIEFVTESKPESTTIKYVIETTSEEQKSTPVYLVSVNHNNNNDEAGQNTGNIQIADASQIIHNVIRANQNPNATITAKPNNEENQVTLSSGNVVTDGFYSSINNVRTSAALAQVEKPQDSTVTQANVTTTTNIPTSTLNEELKAYFVQQETNNENSTVTEIKPVLGVPFAKPNSVAYTLVRTDDKQTKVAKDGSVYAGQIVEASVSEDHDYNKQKANLLNRRAPIRLVAVAENKDASTTTTQRVPQKATVVKARIPPKSRLTYDDRTGEPVLRIYASYVDSPAQREAIKSKLSANAKNFKEIAPRSKDSATKWKEATVKALAKPHGFEPSQNQVTEFGLKLKSRSDDYVPLFDDYEE